ncbi:MAG: MFS transporter [Ilumatobacter sp.]|uniref:MFS transporter n=1 Tax=Ilumatobacter sp. TaxID=1967498 RepID=UPI00391D3B8D
MTIDERPRDVLRGLVMPVYLPTVAGTFGLALLVPVLPLYLTDAGLSLRVTSIVLASVGAGATLGGLPAGAAIARFGERRIMFVALGALAITAALLGVTDAAIALVALRLGTGMANIALRLSRQTYITRQVGPLVRGRAMSTLGGAFRMSLFVGPLLGGVLADTFGFTTTFAVAGAVTAVGVIAPLLSPDVIDEPPPVGSAPARPPIGLAATIRTHRRLLAMVAIVPMLTMAVREGRYVVVPLIGDDLGLSPTAVGALVTVGTTADLLLFPVAGFVMDRFGRLAAMIPSFGLMTIGLVILGAADTTTGAVVAGATMGIGNGLSSGTLLTLGSDLAPDEGPGPFLAAIAVIQDSGKIIGPLVVGFVGSAAGLGAASFVLAGLMVVVILWLVFVLGETSRRSTA